MGNYFHTLFNKYHYNMLGVLYVVLAILYAYNGVTYKKITIENEKAKEEKKVNYLYFGFAFVYVLVAITYCLIMFLSHHG